MAILEIHRVQLVQRRSLKFCLVRHWLVFVLEDPAGSWRILEFYVVLLYGKSLEGFCRCSRVRGLCLKLVAGLFAWFGSEGSQKESYRISITSCFMIRWQMPWRWLLYALGTLTACLVRHHHP